MMGIGFPELMIILVIIMIIFGAGKLPEIGNAFGKSIKNFKKSMKEAEEESIETPAGETATESEQTPAQEGAPQTAQASTAKTEKTEEEMIDEAALEIKENRINTIKTPHDGLVQQRDVFTESVKKSPFGRTRDRGVSRDVL